MKNYNISRVATKINYIISRSLLTLALSSFSLIASANTRSHSELGPWSAMFYVGETAKEVFIDAITGKFSHYGETIYAAELAYTLDERNPLRRFLKPIFDIIEVAGNLAYRRDRTHNDNVKEANLYLVFRFSRFPWGDYLRNSIAIGDGLSYASHPPFADLEPGIPVNENSRFLNYLMIEITFALPKYPELQLVLRSHHRCTAWGTFPGNANSGSTNVGLGIRYYF